MASQSLFALVVRCPVSHFRLQKHAQVCPLCAFIAPFGELCIEPDLTAVSAPIYYPKPFAITVAGFFESKAWCTQQYSSQQCEERYTNKVSPKMNFIINILWWISVI